MAFELIIMAAILGAEPVDIPSNVAKWRDQCVADHEANVKKGENALKTMRESQKKAKIASEKKELLRRIKEVEAQLKEVKDIGPSYTLAAMPDQPKVGNLGLVKMVVVVDVLDASSAIVKRQENLAFVGPERRGTAVEFFSVKITGVDTTTWPKDRAIEINDYFEATHVDKTTQLIVLKPFDIKKWKATFEAK